MCCRTGLIHKEFSLFCRQSVESERILSGEKQSANCYRGYILNSHALLATAAAQFQFCQFANSDVSFRLSFSLSGAEQIMA